MAHLGQSGREGGRFSPSFQMNTLVLQIRIYTQMYNFFFFFLQQLSIRSHVNFFFHSIIFFYAVKLKL